MTLKGYLIGSKKKKKGINYEVLDCKKEYELSDNIIESLIEIELLKLEYGLAGEDHNDG